MPCAQCLFWNQKNSDCGHKDQVREAGPDTGLDSQQGAAPYKIKAKSHYYLQPLVQTLGLDFSPGHTSHSQSHLSKWQYNPLRFPRQTYDHSWFLSFTNRPSPIDSASRTPFPSVCFSLTILIQIIIITYQGNWYSCFCPCHLPSSLYWQPECS